MPNELDFDNATPKLQHHRSMEKTVKIELSKQTQYVVFVIDSSGSMMVNGYMNALNNAMEEVLFIMENFLDSHLGKEIKVSILSFGSKPKWIVFDPECPRDLFWNDLVASGATFFGETLWELEKLLNRISPPIQEDDAAMTIVFTADGVPGDPWEKKFEKIKNNETYKHARKYAIAIGEEAQSLSNEYLAILTGESKSVFFAPKPADVLFHLKRITEMIVGSN